MTFIDNDEIIALKLVGVNTRHIVLLFVVTQFGYFHHFYMSAFEEVSCGILVETDGIDSTLSKFFQMLI